MVRKDFLADMGQLVKVAVCVPTEGHTPVESYDNRLMFSFHLGKLEMISKLPRDEGWNALRKKNNIFPEKDGYELPEFEFYWACVGRVLTPLARERLCEFAMDGGADLILQIDDDMITPIDMFERLYDTMREHNADVVAPLAFMRHEPHFPVIYRVKEGYDPVARQPYFQRDFVKNYPKNAVVECDAAGFGSVLIRMDLLKKMKKPWFMSTTSSGEDVWFCTCAKKEAGAKILMDTRVKLGHLSSSPVIDEEYYERYSGIEGVKKVIGEASRELSRA